MDWIFPRDSCIPPEDDEDDDLADMTVGILYKPRTDHVEGVSR